MYYEFKGRKVSPKLQVEIEHVLNRLWKQGFSSLDDYGKYYGFVNGLAVLRDFNVDIAELNG